MTVKQNQSSPLLKKAKPPGQGSMHALTILDQGDDALLSRIHLIRNAQKSIDIQTFIWKRDEVGIKLLKELYDAARRGVKVRLLIDFWIFHEENEVIQFLNVSHRNFEVKLYNPPLENIHADFLSIVGMSMLDFKGVNQRMHNKIFLVDDKIAIIGGRNYDNTYYDRGETRNFIDLDIMVSGPVVSDIIRCFKLYWKYKLSVEFSYFKDIEKNSLQNCADLIDQELDQFNRDLFKRLDREADDHSVITQRLIDCQLRCSDVQFVADKPGKIAKKDKAHLSQSAQRLQRSLALAKSSIFVQSPYFVMSQPAIKLIKGLKERRPKLDIAVSTNSLAATDNVYAYAMLHKEKKMYIKDLGIRLFELKPVPKDMKDFMHSEFVNNDHSQKEDQSCWNDDNVISRNKKFMCIHAKVFIVDRELLWVGTYNADVRSEQINTEMALIIKSRKITGIVCAKIEKICSPENSWVVAPKQYVPVITEINDELTSLSNALPLVDPWPFRNVTCFDIKKGRKPVSIFADEFYDRYETVGAFPQVSNDLKEKEIKIRLIKTFGKVMKPIV